MDRSQGSPETGRARKLLIGSVRAAGVVARWVHLGARFCSYGCQFP